MKTALLLAAIALFILPSATLADTTTIYRPGATAPNNTSVATGSSSDRNSVNYVGGSGQFDLDHHNAYTWRIAGIAKNQNITSATLTFKDIANWDLTRNMLFVHLLNSAQSGVRTTFDVGGVPVTDISDYFNTASSTFGTPALGTDNIFLFQQGFLKVQQTYSAINTPWTGCTSGNSLGNCSAAFTSGTYTGRDYVYSFSTTALVNLRNYINAGAGTTGDVAFGFDPDCHFWNNGIEFAITTAPTATPEPATLALLGTGLMSTGFYLRRRRKVMTNTEK